LGYADTDLSFLVTAWSLFDTAIRTISPASTTVTISPSTTPCSTSSLLLALLPDWVLNLWLLFLSSFFLWLLFLCCWQRRIWQVLCWLRPLHLSHSIKSAQVRYVFCYGRFLGSRLLTHGVIVLFVVYGLLAILPPNLIIASTA
jgi:hypothetical protein